MEEVFDESWTEEDYRAAMIAQETPWIAAGKRREVWLAEKGFDKCTLTIRPYRFRRMDPSPPSGSGVYFLFDEDDELLYVGKAAHLWYRLETHWRQDRVPFTRVAWIELEHAATDMLEAYCIEHMEPSMNRKFDGRMASLSERLAAAIDEFRAHK